MSNARISPDDRIVVTGAAGFIGSYLIGFLNRAGYRKLILVDDFSRADKAPNLVGKAYEAQIHRDDFVQWLRAEDRGVRGVFHLGARTDTTEMDYSVHRVLNLEYSQEVWRACSELQIPLLYASSAATYGAGEHGYNDDHETIPALRPLNPYGQSKQDFDVWALAQTDAPPHWAGVKFFNVYGPNEYHKGRMASVVLHAYRQIQQTGGMKLFRSHRDDCADGEQSRDFVYVDDVARICYFLLADGMSTGIFNVGSGVARSFNDLAAAVFAALGKFTNITYVDTPADIRDTYQYFTEAALDKLRAAGYTAPTRSLEEGITAYVQAYLSAGAYF